MTAHVYPVKSWEPATTGNTPDDRQFAKLEDAHKDWAARRVMLLTVVRACPIDHVVTFASQNWMCPPRADHLPNSRYSTVNVCSRDPRIIELFRSHVVPSGKIPHLVCFSYDKEQANPFALRFFHNEAAAEEQLQKEKYRPPSLACALL